jgi:acyl-CoA synthetase (NDP forming)
VLLYLESFGNPAKFARLARRIGRRKPILAVKSGRTAAGRRAASSHTAAMAADDDAVDALLRHCGVVRVDTIDDLLDTALVVAHQPLPRGNRLAIIGNSGGPGVMAADACPSAGLELAELSTETADRLRLHAAASASVTNPVDMLGDAGPAIYAEAVACGLADPNVDAAIVVHTPTLVADPDAIAEAIAAVATDKPIVSVLIGRERGLLAGPERPVPVFGSVESAVAALGHVVSYARWRERPVEDEPTRPDIRLDVARTVVDGALAATPAGRWLAPLEVSLLLGAYGVPVIASEAVLEVTEATCAAGRLGYPVALKAQGAGLVHKTDVGGVALGLRTAAEVERAWAEMKQRLGPDMTGAVVQRMAGIGVELIAGIVRDDTFGPLVLFGMGGTMAELIGDRAVRVAPIAETEAVEVVLSLRCSPLLTGYRGSEPVDVAGLAELLVRLGLLARDVPELAELDLNPVIATAAGVVAVDARVRVTPPPPNPIEFTGTRRLAPPRPALT